MTPDEATKALTAQREEIDSAITDTEAARKKLSSVEPCGAKPNPEYARALGDLVYGMSRGIVALLRTRKAEIEGSLAAMAFARKTRQGLINAILGRAVQIAVILIGIGIFTVAVRAETLLKLLKNLFG